MTDAIKKRRSIRRFKKGKIDEKEILEILEKAILAPSAGNTQPWEFVIVKTEQQKKKLAMAAFGQDFISDAPFVIVVCADQSRSISVYGERGKLYSIQDTAAAIENILLTVTEKGFGACWVGAFDENMVRKIINCPVHVKPVAVIPVGIPDEKPDMPERTPLKKVLHWERF